MKTKEFIMILLYDILIVAIFAALAVTFNHWWIVLFGILFMSFPTTIRRHYRLCDQCGARSEPADSPEAAITKAKAAGWIHYDGANTDYCPKCAKQHSKE